MPLILYLTGLVFIVLLLLLVKGPFYDDAYIFCRYARNIRDGKGFVFNEEYSGFGVSNIVWTLLLAYGTPDPLISYPKMALIYSGLFLLLNAYLVEKLSRRLARNEMAGLTAAAAYLLFPAAHRIFLSGMDTNLNTFALLLFFITAFKRGERHPILLGILATFVIYNRPEAGVACLVGFIYIFFTAVDKKRAALQLLYASGICILLTFPYFLYFYIKFGLFTPPTRMGKLFTVFPYFYPGMEYKNWVALGVLSKIILFSRYVFTHFISLSSQRFHSLLGAAAIVSAVGTLFRHKRIPCELIAIYSFLFIGFFLYALKFPLAEYRYFNLLTPANIVLVVWGLWLAQGKRIESFLQNPSRVTPLVVGLLMVYVFVFTLTIRVSQKWENAAAVQREVGDWLRNNTTQRARVAVEPMGAISFYSERYIIDLGGLVDVSLWPYLKNGISDSNLILRCLKDNYADYVITWESSPTVGRVIAVKLGIFREIRRFRPRTPIPVSQSHYTLVLYKTNFNRCKDSYP